MITRIVLFNSRRTEEAIQAGLDRAMDELAELPGVVSFRFLRIPPEQPQQAFDRALLMEFEDMRALNQWLSSDVHLLYAREVFRDMAHERVIGVYGDQ